MLVLSWDRIEQPGWVDQHGIPPKRKLKHKDFLGHFKVSTLNDIGCKKKYFLVK